MGTQNFEEGFSRTVKVFGSITTVLCIIVVGLYFFQFNDKLSTNQEVFAQFGDFLAGTITPILTFFTIILLIVSIKYQVSELRNSTQALNDTKSIHFDSLKLQQENLKIQERNTLVPIANERIDKMVTRLFQIAQEPLAPFNFTLAPPAPQREFAFNLENLSNTFGTPLQQLITNQAHFSQVKIDINKQAHKTFKVISNLHEVIQALHLKGVDRFVTENCLDYLDDYLKMLSDCRIHLESSIFKQIEELQNRNTEIRNNHN